GPSGQMSARWPSPGLVLGVQSSKSEALEGVAALPTILPMKNGLVPFALTVMPSVSPTLSVSAWAVLEELMSVATVGRRSSSLVETLALKASTLSGAQ